MLNPVPFTHVTFSDPFLAPRQDTNRLVTIPSQHEILRRGGRFDAWDAVGKWNPKDFFTPHRFWDSDVAKWAEAASYSLATHFDPRLDAQLDAVIAKMARAQMADGYMNSHYQSVNPHARWTSLAHDHELYCAGHLLEAAVAHYRATGKRNFLDILNKYVDHIEATFTRNPRMQAAYDGHQEIELALVKLYHVSGEKRHLDLARHFIDVRGQGRSVLGHNPAHRDKHFYDVEARRRGEDPKDYWAKTYEYVQAHKPVREHDQIVGHAVRAVYLYAAVADLAAELNDAGYLAVCERVWHHLVSRRLYVTGGLGVAARNEGFTSDYDLPEETAYAETCASIGLVFWAHRMLNITGDSRYADEIERAIYNNIPAGVSLDGTQYFYENPLASRGAHHRQDWFDCACCPPNVARTFASLGGYAFASDDNGLWVHLYAQGEARFVEFDAALQVTGNYPWDGMVTLTLTDAPDREFDLRLRIPGWCHSYGVRVNGVRAARRNLRIERGYLVLSRRWKKGDVVRLDLDMPIQTVHANPHVRAAAGKVALQRGPVVYCIEGADHADVELQRVSIDAANAGLTAAWEPGLLGGIVALRGTARVVDDAGWGDALYRPQASLSRDIALTAIPYAAWDNRAPGQMQVWLRAG